MGAVLVLVVVGFGCLAAGVLIGRYYVPDDRQLKRAAKHGKSYIRAVNSLLARDRLGAEAQLVEVVSENTGDVEPYFALAALFRARGEHERAIRVHQAIALRQGAGKKARLRTGYELGLDFRAAGMPRRATRAMEQCLADDSKHEGAMRALCGLYEEQGRYGEAAGMWQRLYRLVGGERGEREHHLLVAAAQTAIQAGDLDSAKRYLRDAERQDEESPHLLVVAAELAAAKGNNQGASARLRQALSVSPELAGFLVPGLIEAERALLDAEPRGLLGRRKRSEASADGEGRADDDRDDESHGEAIGEADGDAEAADGDAAAADAETGPVGDADAARGEDEEGGDPSLVIATNAEERVAERAAAAIEEVLEAIGLDGHLMLAVAELRSLYDPARALDDFRAAAEAFPDLLPARVAAGRLALAADDPDAIRAELARLVRPDGTLSWTTEHVWRCSQCGVRRDAFYWRCGACRQWGTARLDVGREALVAPAPPRERRALPRAGAEVAYVATRDAGLLGDSGAGALTTPELDSGLSDDEMQEAGRRRSPLGRLGGWLSGAWTSLRGGKKQASLPPPRDR